MKSVFVVSSGCIYEGGGVDAVFLRNDLAVAKFWTLVDEKRAMNRETERQERERALRGEFRLGKDGSWLEEKHEDTVCEVNRWTENCIIFGSDFISLRVYQCEE